MKAWRANNKSKVKDHIKKPRRNSPDSYARVIKFHYGLTMEGYVALLKKQDYKCAICGIDHNPQVNRGRLYVDHDHDTAKIRGLLCSACNKGIGFLRHNPELLKKAIQYLSESADSTLKDQLT